MDGLLLIDKPAGISSHNVVAKLRKQLHQDRIGHCGTLDPFATGLLLITLGQATKISNFLEKQNKRYHAILELGTQTDTGDWTGQVTTQLPFSSIRNENLQSVQDQFLGPQTQIPPMYSAKKINGKKLYELARQGESVERKPQTIEIFDLKLSQVSFNRVEIDVTCSVGTYIRTLGEDIANALNTVGHLVELRRVQSGPFKIDNALSPDMIDLKTKPISIIESLAHLPHYFATPSEEQAIRNGKLLLIDSSAHVMLIISQETQVPLALYSKQSSGVYECQRGLWSPREDHP